MVTAIVAAAMAIVAVATATEGATATGAMTMAASVRHALANPTNCCEIFQ